MNLKKFSSLGLVTLCFVLPFGAVLSCGDPKSKDPNYLKISIRSEEMNIWNKIVADFQKKTEENGQKINIELDAVGDAASDYELQNGLGNLADIAFVDKNLASKIIREKLDYFQNIDLQEIKKAKYDVFNLKDQKEFDFKDEKNYAFEKIAKVFSVDSGKNKLIGLPFGYSSGGLFVNNNHVDNTKNIFLKIPKDNGEFYEFDTQLEANAENIQNFIDASGKKDDDLDKQIKEEIKNQPYANYFYDFGPSALSQRLHSLTLSIAKSEMPLVQDINFPFELVASEFKDITTKNGVIDDNKLQEYFPHNLNNKKDSDKLKDSFDVLYRSYYGYFARKNSKTGIAIPAKQFGKPGEAEVFASEESPFLIGQKWQLNFLKERKFDTSKISIYSLPYGDTNVELFSLSKQIKGKKLENAYKFLRFAISNKDNAEKITSKKTISPNFQAFEMQKKQFANDQNQEEFLNSFSGENYNGIQGMVFSNSTEGVYNLYSQQLKSELEKVVSDKKFIDSGAIADRGSFFNKFKNIVTSNVNNEIKKML